MKKILSIVTLSIISLSQLSAQSFDANTSHDKRNDFRFGLKAGVNFSNIYDEKGINFETKGNIGFAGGVFVSIPFSDMVGLQPEVIYSEKGFKTSGTILENDFEGKITTTYLDVPLHLQIKPVDNFTFLIGPQLSYLLKTKKEFNSLSIEEKEKISVENFKKSIIGLSLGFDFEINNFLISARGNFDITKTKSDGNNDIRYNNHVFQATVGYIF